MGKGLDYIVNIKDGDFGGASKVKSAMQGLDAAVAHTQQVVNGLGNVVVKAGAIINGGFNVKSVSGAIEHMATMMSGNGPANLKGAFALVSSALQNPAKGFAALHTAGDGLNTSQKGLITTVTKHSQAQKAHASVLQQLQTEFGKSTKVVHSAIGPVGDLHGAFDKLGTGLDGLINDGLKAATPALSAVQAVTEGLSTAQGILTTVQETLAAGQEVLTAAQWALNVAMDANPIGLIVAGIALLVGGLYLAYEKSENFRAVLAGVGEVAGAIVPIFKGLGEIILGALTLNPSMVIDGFKDAYNGVQNIVAKGGISGLFNEGFDKSKAESKKAEDERKKKEADNKNTGAVPALAHTGGGKTGPQTIPAGKAGKAAGRNSTALAGGGAVRNVHITINKLVEKLEFHTTNVQGISASDIKKKLTEILLGVVHDSEMAIGPK
jgi:hypothetical protein